MLHAHKVHDHVGPQIGRKTGRQCANEAIVQLVDGPQLRLGYAIRPAEVECNRALASGPVGAAVPLALRYVVHFLLTKLGRHRFSRLCQVIEKALLRNLSLSGQCRLLAGRFLGQIGGVLGNIRVPDV